MIVLGSSSNFTKRQLLRIIDMNDVLYFIDRKLCEYIKGLSEIPCDIAYVIEDSNHFMNNVGLPILNQKVVMPENYNPVKYEKLFENYRVFVLEGGLYG